MTLNLYLHPPGYPALIADLLVSYPRIVETSFFHALARVEDLKLIDQTYGDILAQKIATLEDGSVIAFSGKESDIRDFLTDAPRLLKGRPDGIRTMKYMSGLADDFLRNRGDIAAFRILGFIPQKSLDETWVNIIKSEPTNRYNSKLFNECFAQGTGFHSALHLVNLLDEQFHKLAEKTKLYGPLEDLAGIVGGINAKKFYNIEAPDKNDATWGGYMQCYYFDLANSQLRTFASWAHIGFYFDLDKPQQGLRILNKHLFYRRSQSNHSVQVNTINEHGLSEFTINVSSLLENVHITLPSFSSSSWEQITLTAVLHRDGKTTVVSRTLSMNEIRQVHLDISNGFHLKMDNELTDALMRKWMAVT